MSRETLSHEIKRELEQLNDKIDRKIIKGVPYAREARRHRQLVTTLRRIAEDERDEHRVAQRRTTRRGVSPVRRRLERGTLARLFSFSFSA